MFSFEIKKTISQNRARTGVLTTPHGKVHTPAFIFCATKSALKVATAEDAKGMQFVLGNTYHLMLKPGSQIIKEAGGLAKWANISGPWLTDSGGFQIFSLGYGGVVDEIKGKQRNNTRRMLLKINEEGALFRSYIDGSLHNLTPEYSVDIQRDLGADIIMPLDICTPFHVSEAHTKQFMEQSHRWELRSLKHFEKMGDGSQQLYGIVQGGVYLEARKQSVDFVRRHPFFGQAIGGSLGGNLEEMISVVDLSMRYLNPTKPTHLLGIGGVLQIIAGVEAGVDTFDCVSPTRLARHGHAHSFQEKYCKLNIKNAQYIHDFRVIEAGCDCSTCALGYSRAYIHHLFDVREMLGPVLLTRHNIRFMTRLFQQIRTAIEQNEWALFKENLLNVFYGN